MAKFIKYAIGLDIGKEKYDACLAVIDEDQKVNIKSSKSGLANTVKGFKELLLWVEKHLQNDIPKLFCMEATGIYHEQLAWFLHQQGYMVSVLVPNKARYYMRSIGMKSKDDKIDAKGLAMMAAQQSLKQWRPISNEIYELRQLTRYYQQLQKHRTMLRNQCQAIILARSENDIITKGLKDLMESVDVQITEITGAIKLTLMKDLLLWKKVEYINSVKGLGIISIATVIAETDGFALFENRAQLVSYCGYDVVRNQSGKRVGGTKISKKGNSHIRRILFMPAFSVVRYRINPFVNLYERVFEKTRIKMKAYVAVQRKLLILIYVLWKREEVFKPQMHPEMETRLLSFR
jgi:transposase